MKHRKKPEPGPPVSARVEVHKVTDKIEFTPDDIAAARAWLNGKTKRGSTHDLQARQTLARMLRSRPTDIGLLAVLADAVDPDGRGGRQLILKRKAGRPRRGNQELIALFVWQKMQAGVQWEPAVREAMDNFRVSRGKVANAWREWRAHFKNKPQAHA